MTQLSSIPLVSCICPTLASRRAFLPRAIACFPAQDYPCLELIVIRESGPSLSGVCRGRSIRYVSDANGIGAARNTGCRVAHGEVICHFDDDDYSAPGRVSHQVGLLQVSGKAFVGYNAVACEETRQTVIWTDEGRRPGSRFWRWQLANPRDAWGLSYCYRRDWWEQHPFPEIAAGEDGPFLNAALDVGEALVVDGGNRIVAINHVGNGSGRLVGSPDWKEMAESPYVRLQA